MVRYTEPGSKLESLLYLLCTGINLQNLFEIHPLYFQGCISFIYSNTPENTCRGLMQEMDNSGFFVLAKNLWKMYFSAFLSLNLAWKWLCWSKDPAKFYQVCPKTLLATSMFFFAGRVQEYFLIFSKPILGFSSHFQGSQANFWGFLVDFWDFYPWTV